MRATLLSLLLTPVLAVLPAAAAPPADSPLPSLRAEAFDLSAARHLLARAGFGSPAEEVEKYRVLGLDRAVENLVNFHSLPDMEFPSPVTHVEPLDPTAQAKLTPDERLKVNQQRQRDEQQQMMRVRDWWVRRMIQSPRPLEEKLVLFWHGHFANEFKTVRNSEAMFKQNQRFRTHATGNFGTLLQAMVRDPAMLRYLDNNRNTRNRPNENLAREVMELFAMGEGQGYTEADVKEGARALTGHTFDPRTWEYKYIAAAHDPGMKTIFGKSGKHDADAFVRLILDQPATARFIVRKLFVFFAHDDPADAVIDRLAAVLRANNYELAPVLRELFRSEEFYAPRSVGTQIKSPVQLVVGSARVLKRRDFDPNYVANATRLMGQELFEPPGVKGWDGGRVWINANTQLARSNFPAQLLAPGGKKAKAKGEWAVAPFDAVAYLDGKPLAGPQAVIDEFARVLFAVPLSAAQKTELLEFLGPLPPQSDWSARRRDVNAKFTALLVLMMGTPEFQLT